MNINKKKVLQSSLILSAYVIEWLLVLITACLLFVSYAIFLFQNKSFVPVWFASLGALCITIYKCRTRFKNLNKRDITRKEIDQEYEKFMVVGMCSLANLNFFIFGMLVLIVGQGNAIVTEFIALLVVAFTGVFIRSKFLEKGQALIKNKANRCPTRRHPTIKF